MDSPRPKSVYILLYERVGNLPCTGGGTLNVSDEDRMGLVRAIQSDLRTFANSIKDDWRTIHCKESSDIPLVYIDHSPQPWTYSMGTVAACDPKQAVDFWAETKRRSDNSGGKHAVVMASFSLGEGEVRTFSYILRPDEETAGDVFEKLGATMRSERVSSKQILTIC
jgi:hypothetical protein